MSGITDIFVKRPVLAISVNILLFIAGVYAYLSITTRQYPRSDLAVVKVTTAYFGADAELIKGFITTPLEKVIASADGIDYIESSSQQGLSQITAHLVLNYDINSALTQIQSKVAQVRNELPVEAESPVIDVETADNRFASLYLSFYSEDLERNKITDYLLRVVQPKLTAVQGVQKADLLGSRTFAMRIWLDPLKMASLDVTPLEVQEALRANNVLSAPGSTKGYMTAVPLNANTNLETKEQFENLIIRSSSEAVIRLDQIAKIELGAESYEEDVRFDGKGAVFIGVWALPNANSLDVIDEVRKILPEIEANLPEGLELGIPYDATEYVKDALQEVIKTLVETVIIVILVIFLFIGSLRSVLVPILAIPLSLVGGLVLILWLGFTLNLLTLLAIVLAVGLVVDDAIVVLENIERHIGEGKDPMSASLIGARELVGPIIAMTITLAAVYAPIGFQGGLTGTLFKEFALTLSGAVFFSGFVALTLSPMMCSKLLRQKSETEETRLQKAVGSLFEKVQHKYNGALKTVLGYQSAFMVFSVGFMLLCIPFYMFSTKELAPQEDQGIIFGIVQAAPNSTLDQTLRYTEVIHERYKSFDEYQTSFQITGPTFGFSGILLKPFSERNQTAQALLPQVWGKVGTVPGVRVIATSPAPLPGGSDFPVEFVISSTDSPKLLLDYSKKIVDKALESGIFMFADGDLKYDLPQATVKVDKEKASLLGINLAQVAGNLSAYTGGNYVNRFSIEGRSYKVIPLAQRSSRLTSGQLNSVYLRGTRSDSLIPLSSIATIENKVIPRSLNKFQQLNSVKIQGANVPGTTIDQALQVLENAAQEVLPSDYVIDYAGESRQLRKEGNSLMITFLFSFILIYLVLASQFESFRDPFIILFGSVPLAISGALVLPFFWATSMNIYSQVGLVTLAGLVAKNGILLVEFANQMRHESGYTKYDAIVAACHTRLRPILMTSVATVVGHFPLILAAGPGASARNSIGIVLVSGMIIGTAFTLFVVPMLYLLISKESGSTEDGHGSEEIKSENKLSRITALGLVLLSGITLTGCSVGPDYVKPEIDVQKAFTKKIEQESQEEAPKNWWRSFNDPGLVALIEESIPRNTSVNQAVARIKQARSLKQLSLSELLPGLQLGASYDKGRASAARFPGGGEEGEENATPRFDFEVYSTSIDAAWELDFFGRLRRGVEASGYSLQQRVAEVEDAVRILVSDIAVTYLQLRGYQLQVQLAEESVKNQLDSLAITKAKQRAGEVSELDVMRVISLLEETRALVPETKAQVDIALHRLSVLTALSIPSLEEKLLPAHSTMVLIPTIEASFSIPSPERTLKNRPDVRAAEKMLAEQTARVGIETGDLFPKVSIIGSIGLMSRTFEALDSKGARTWTFGPSISWTPFDLGRIRARITSQEAVAEQALYAYEATVRTALEEAENSLSQVAYEKERLAHFTKALSAQKRAYEIARLQYKEGLVGLLDVLDTQRELLSIKTSVAASTVNNSIFAIGVFKSFAL